jgi:hypothetical protein
MIYKIEPVSMSVTPSNFLKAFLGLCYAENWEHGGSRIFCKAVLNVILIVVELFACFTRNQRHFIPPGRRETSARQHIIISQKI